MFNTVPANNISVYLCSMLISLDGISDTSESHRAGIWEHRASSLLLESSDFPHHCTTLNRVQFTLRMKNNTAVNVF